MRGPDRGPVGVAALVFVVLIQVTALAVISPGWLGAAALITAAITSRVAVLLAAEDHVADTRRPPVWVLGTGEYLSHSLMSEWEDFTVSPAAVSGRLAYRRAGVRDLTGREPARPADALILQVAVIGAQLLDWPATPLDPG